MSDLVEKVREAMAHNGDVVGFNSPTTDQQARAAITAVLDDLMEPDSELLETAGLICSTDMDGPYRLSIGGWQAYEHWTCILNGIRAQLGLGSPVEPQDAPNAPDPTHPPQNR